MQDPVTAEHAHITASTARGRQPTQTETTFFFVLFFLSELFVFSELHKRWCDAETWRRSHGNTQRRERGQRLGGGSSEGEGSEVRWTQTWCHMLVTERSRNLTSKSGHERQTEREREKNKQIHVFISTRMGGGHIHVNNGRSGFVNRRHWLVNRGNDVIRSFTPHTVTVACQKQKTTA